jgi:hypothetical protein
MSGKVRPSIAVIEAAGFDVALVSAYAKPILAVTQGPVPGSVVLRANALALAGRSRAGRFFNWQATSDGGQTFIGLPPTSKAKTSLASLPPLTTHGFRVSVTTSDGVTGPWSQVVAFLVH